ncbi:MMPL family transporter, partial [Streptomyces europaeiscabiei]
AVVFAGLTVVIALAGLAVVNVPMLTKMGLAAAGGGRRAAGCGVRAAVAGQEGGARPSWTVIRRAAAVP